MNELLVIGSLNMDMVIRVHTTPRAGETILGELQAYLPGGKGANQAYAAGRAGGKVAMLGKIGQDAFGTRLKEELVSAGVDVSALTACERPTGQAVINVTDAGENSIVVLPGANGACDVDFIRAHEALIADSEVVLLQMEIPHEAVFEAIRLAHAHGRKVLLNPAPAPERLPEAVLPLIDVLLPNETELERLSGLPVRDTASARAAAEALMSKGVGCVLATLGSRGALYCAADETIESPAFHVTAVDTTAAGDTFCACFALGMARGWPVRQALLYSNASSALSVTKPGAQPSIPTRAETLAFLAERGVAF